LKTFGGGAFGSVQESLDYAIPAWTAGIQINMDVSGTHPWRTWMPAIHAGMTMIFILYSVVERSSQSTLW
jgi:hypothetical protein